MSLDYVNYAHGYTIHAYAEDTLVEIQRAEILKKNALQTMMERYYLHKRSGVKDGCKTEGSGAERRRYTP